MNRLDAVDQAATRLTRWPGQSLAEGAAGIALLHIELAATGRSDGQRARTWIKQATSQDISIGGNAGLYFGAPAIEFVLRAAAPSVPTIAEHALTRLEAATDRVVHDRLRAAAQRQSCRALPALAEFDLIRGFTGLAVVLLGRGPGTPLLGDVLAYLVALTRPVHRSGHALPGWWTGAGPAGNAAHEFADGHGNNGMAHGIAGPLAMLALALRHGARVDGHTEAIARITGWLEQWPAGGAPYWSTTAEPFSSPSERAARPSWCYGALGVLRAQQLAALAVGDDTRRATAEHAAHGIVTDPAILRLTRDTTLCHGWAGLVATTAALAADCPNPDLFTGPIRAMAEQLAAAPALEKTGLLEGRVGVALALNALNNPPRTGWARALLIS